MYDKGALLSEGKTKRIWEDTSSPRRVIIESKDDITAGDGAKHDLIVGKAELATTTTCNVFNMLLRRNLNFPIAFIGRIDTTRFAAFACEMLPFEVVIRREAHGSYVKRHPAVEKGTRFTDPLVEWYLKTNGKRWEEHDLPKDDPLLRFLENGGAALYRPDLPFQENDPFLILPKVPLGHDLPNRDYMEEVARVAFIAIEEAWAALGRTLVDMKIEFGTAKDGRVVIADVIDNDSWRVLENGKYIDKQFYRDGGSVDATTALYKHVAELTSRF